MKNLQITLDPQIEEREYDLGFMIPDSQLTWIINGKSYVGLSRVERNEVELGHPIYKKGTKELLEGLPMTSKFNGQKVQLTGTQVEDFWIEGMNTANPSMSKAEVRDHYLALTKDGVAFTDHPQGNIFFYNPVITTNQPVYLTGKKNSLSQLEFKTLKVGSLSSMRAQVEEFPLLKMRATISTRSYQGRGVIRFDQMKGSEVFFFPFNTSTVGYIDEWRVRKMSRSELIPSPYYP